MTLGVTYLRFLVRGPREIREEGGVKRAVIYGTVNDVKHLVERITHRVAQKDQDGVLLIKVSL